MRFEGKLSPWNDARGFGFLTPDQGGSDIFVHIKALGIRGGRPEIGRRFSFEIEPGPHGRKSARNVLLAQQWLRHKSVKAEFRSLFWLTVVINVALLIGLVSPIGRS